MPMAIPAVLAAGVAFLEGAAPLMVGLSFVGSPVLGHFGARCGSSDDVRSECRRNAA